MGKNNSVQSKIVFIGAHFDDEVLIAPLLRRHIKSGDHVELVYTTRPVNQASAKIRLKELRKGLVALGLSFECCTSLPFPDRRSYLFAQELYEALKKHILRLEPSIIYIPAFEGGNCDHDVLHVLVARIVKSLEREQSIRLREFSLYNSAGQGSFFQLHQVSSLIHHTEAMQEVITLTAEEHHFAWRYFRIYTSQFFPIMAFLLISGQWKRLFRDVVVRDVPSYDYLSRPAKVLTYEQYQDVTFSDYIESVEFLFQQQHRNLRTVSLENDRRYFSVFHNVGWIRDIFKRNRSM
jgi:LmbE family N-acetylglucosaminyl deacetylase